MIDRNDDAVRPDDAIAPLVAAAAPVRFDAGFTDRVMSRLATSRDASLATALQRHVRRIVPLAAAATLALAAFNWWGARDTTSSPIDAALNLPQVSLATAYSSSSLYGIADGSTEMP